MKRIWQVSIIVVGLLLIASGKLIDSIIGETQVIFDLSWGAIFSLVGFAAIIVISIVFVFTSKGVKKKD